MKLLDLKDKKGLIVGIANDRSIAYGCAKILRQAGADLAITYQNEKSEKYVRPLADELDSIFTLPCDVQKTEEIDVIFEAIQQKLGKLDFLIHSIAYAPKIDLHGRITDCSLDGFLMAMDISCHSFIRFAKHAEPLMKDGGSLLTVSYYGAEKVVKNYNMMGPVKAALESTVKYLAAELGVHNIRVNALSPGAINTRAGSGIYDFDKLLESSLTKSALHRAIDLDDIGNMAAFLVSDLSKNITGGIHMINAGYDIVD